MNSRILALGLAGALALAPVAPADAQGDLLSRILRGAIVAGQGLFITDAQETQLGVATARQILAQVPQFPDPALKDYVNRVGKAVAAHSERPNLPYQFFVLDQKEANAFAAPGGFVFITTGALRLMTNEAQLAGVLGHEITHIARKHTVKAIRKALVAQGIASAILDQNSPQLLQAAANVGATLILRGYDRQAELEADRVGDAYAAATGYDPRQLVAFLDTLGRATGEQPKWLMPIADHPRSEDRHNQLSALIASGRIPVRAGQVVGEDRFQTQVASAFGTPAGGPGHR